MKGVQTNSGYELSLNDLSGANPLAYRGLNGQTNNNSYHIKVRRNNNSRCTNGCVFESWCHTNGRINDRSSGVTVIDRRVSFAISSARYRPLASVARTRPSSARLRSLQVVPRISSPFDSSLNPFRFPLDLISCSVSFRARPRLALNLFLRSIFSPALFAASVSTHARPFSVWLSASPLN
jgi:hypothetical protein